MSPDDDQATPASPEASSEHESGIMAEEKQDRASTEEQSPTQRSNSSARPSKSSSKDPSRPRRKKARRACFACQRAHLTCGDERPCLRCIKRGLQDQCHDGVRKKAKYLHDAPTEALMPGFADGYHINGLAHLPGLPSTPSLSRNGIAVSQTDSFYPSDPSTSFSQFRPATQAGRMHPPLLDSNNVINDFSAPREVETPRYQPGLSQQVSPDQEIVGAMDTTSALGNAGTSFDSAFFDQTDPSLFNFNISDLNFGNHYGALEFGMLGHMSSGAVGTPEVDLMNPMAQPNQSGMAYDVPNFPPGCGFGPSVSPWQNVPNTVTRQGSTGMWATQGTGMDAYAIGEQSLLTGQSPLSQDLNASYLSPETPFHADPNSQQELLRQSLSQVQQQESKTAQFPGGASSDHARKRQRQTSEIYSSVLAPYSYTQGFHALTAFLQKRFSSRKVLRIAKALATIRPSFISCNKNLNHDDLIFMEKCFQRTLCEYEDFVNHYGTPTIICRRTGEIAAVSKEFSLVTGWRRSVLLGREPNLNVNTGGNSSGTQTGSSTRGVVTPRIPNVDVDTSRPQAVFLAELLDEDSVVQFYEDFAELAFGASRTSIIGAPCSLLRYRTRENLGWGPSHHSSDEGKRVDQLASVKTEALVQGEAGMEALGQQDGRVDCSMCWTVKRDVFDIPMLIVMNFLPII